MEEGYITNMETLLFIIVVAAFFYACLIQFPLNIIKLLNQLSKENYLPDRLDIQTIGNSLQMAVWIREREQIQILDADPENGTGSILITCRNVTYQILVEQTESGIRRMTVDLKFIKRLEAIKQISYILEADRIRWYIMEHTDPAFAKRPQIFYGTVQNMFRFRYIVFGIVGWVLSYATIMIALQLASGKDSFEKPCQRL